jgi:hypothetical protein
LTVCLSTALKDFEISMFLDEFFDVGRSKVDSTTFDRPEGVLIFNVSG